MNTACLAGASLALFSLALAPQAHASPNDYVLSPIVEQGEKEVDFKWGFERFRDGSSGAAASLGLGWGGSSWWFGEIYAKGKREPDDQFKFDAWELENRFQLTETGRYPEDVGFLLEIERPRDRTEGYEITWGPLLQAEWGAVQGNLNLLWQKHVKASTTFDNELHYQVQLKYLSSGSLDWGVQALGNLGPWDHWSPSSAQEHKLGPALFGKFKTGQHEAVKYNAALLFGTNHNTSRVTLRLQSEYEF